MVSNSKNSDTKQLPGRWFPKKRYIPMISSRKPCNLTYHQRLVYSYLVFRRSRDQGATRKKIATVLDIDREAASRASKHLVTGFDGQPPLAEWREGRLWALEPVGEVGSWFAFNGRSGDPWHRQFSSYRVYTPSKSCPLTTKANGLLWLLYSLAPRWGRPIVINQNHLGLSRLQGVTEKCIHANLGALAKHGLITEGTLMFSMQQPNPDQLEWWRDQPAKKTSKGKNKFLLDQALNWAVDSVKPEDTSQVKQAKEDMRSVIQCFNRFANEMLAAKYSEEDIVAFWMSVKADLTTVNRLLAFVLDFETTFKQAEAIHAEKGFAKSSINLLRSLSEKLVERIKREAP